MRGLQDNLEPAGALLLVKYRMSAEKEMPRYNGYTLYRSRAKFHFRLVRRTDGRHLHVKSVQEFAKHRRGQCGPGHCEGASAGEAAIWEMT